MTTLYGIPNCDTCRKARKWLEENAVTHRFHDIRADGLEPVDIHHWAEKVGWETLLNTRSQTWRKVPQHERESIDAGRAISLMYAQPTLIERPVLVSGSNVLVGFDEKDYGILL